MRRQKAEHLDRFLQQRAIPAHKHLEPYRMPPEDAANPDLLYHLEDRPAPLPATLAALQHVLAAFVGIITPPLIIGSALGLNEHLPYLISMALMVSGAGTFIQARRPWGIGAGMICLQGTSFAFLGAILSAGFMVKQRGGSLDDILAMIFGVCFFGSLVQVVLSRFIGQVRRVLTPLVTGIVITLIGISLIKVGITDLGGGFGATDFGAPGNLALGGFVLVVVVMLSRSESSWVRLSAIVIGLMAGSLAAWFSGKLVPHALPEMPLITVPVPFRFGFAFDWSVFLPVALIYLISSIETVGDLTANCMLSRQPLEGPAYVARLKGGVLGDAVSCMIAATFSAFPNTTFAQNNGVIQLTGVASRHVGLYIGAILFLLGLVPVIGAVLQQIPKPVLGGATLVMFGSVAAAGVRIMAHNPLDRRNMLIIATSFGVGLGIASQPELLHHFPTLVQNLFDSAITSGGVTAVLLSLALPRQGSTATGPTPSLSATTVEKRL
jgi:xanthine permease XanP